MWPEMKENEGLGGLRRHEIFLDRRVREHQRRQKSF
jgi:hypothetical protein